jgi:hypothetical protein
MWSIGPVGPMLAPRPKALGAPHHLPVRNNWRAVVGCADALAATVRPGNTAVYFAPVNYAVGVHKTWSIRDAPVKIMTRRSKPSALPLA